MSTPKLSKEQVEQAKECVRRVEQLLAQLATERAEFEKRANTIKEEIGATYRAAQDHGLSVPVLKGLVEKRKIEREKQQILRNSDTQH